MIIPILLIFIFFILLINCIMKKYFRIFLLLFVISSTYTRAQYISTIAGTGAMGTSGDGGPAVLAELWLPYGVAVDSAGNVYVAEAPRVRKINTAGIISTYAGSLIGGVWAGDGIPATAAILPGIIDIKFDRYWNLHIAASSGARIVKVNSAGVVYTVAGNGTWGYSGDGGQATAAQLQGCDFIAFDTAGNLYISDNVTSRIRKVNTAGIITTIAGTGVSGFSGDGGPASAAQLNHPGPGHVDRQGNIYIFDRVNYRVRKIDTSGIITTIAGTGINGFSGDGGPATAAQFGEMRDLTMDTAGNIYICDVTYSAIRKIAPSGIISTIVGGPAHYGFGGDGGPATAALVVDPNNIALYKDGNIYFSDRHNGRIRMISSRPYFTHSRYQGATFCSGTASTLDTLLAANDSNAGNHEYWSLIAGPSHGTASVACTTISTGHIVYPTGLTYTSGTGYIGLDTITVRITDSIASDTTTIFINVVAPPNAGTITGPDTVCMDASITLTDTAPGGVWGRSNSNGMISGGIVTGITLGLDTFTYTVTNVCGSAIAPHVVRIKGCTAGAPSGSPQGGEVIRILPNPNNGTFSVSLSSNNFNDAHIIVINTLGEKVKELTIPANKNTDVKLDCLPGVYFLNAFTNDGIYYSKIVVTK